MSLLGHPFCVYNKILSTHGSRDLYLLTGRREIERERERVVEILFYFHNFHLNLKNKKTKCKTFDKVPTVTIKMCSERQKQRQAERQTDKQKEP